MFPTSIRRILTLLCAALLLGGCYTSLKTRSTDWPPVPGNLERIGVLPENVHTVYATPAHRYDSYKADLLAELTGGDANGIFEKSTSTPYFLEIDLSCAPPTISDLDAPVIGSPPWVGAPVRQNSCFEYKARYGVRDTQGVMVHRGEVTRDVEGYTLGWFWGVSEDGAYAIWNRAGALLERQGAFVARDAARRVAADLVENAHVFERASGGDSTFAVAASAPTVPAEAAVPVPPRQAGDRTGYALVVGINHYRHFPVLQNAAEDAVAVGRVLEEEYGYSVDVLVDRSATRSGIITALRGLVARLREGDNVVVYFAGHGVIDDVFNEGYWVPVDAESQSDYISNSEIHKAVEAMEKAQHVLLVADSCFAGKFLTRGDSMRAVGVRATNEPSLDDYYRKIDRRKSRMVITSGGNEPVLDGGREGHSVFAYYLLRALQYPDQPTFSGVELATRLQKVVSNNAMQTPTVGYLKSAGHEEGAIVLRQLP